MSTWKHRPNLNNKKYYKARLNSSSDPIVFYVIFIDVSLLILH